MFMRACVIRGALISLALLLMAAAPSAVLSAEPMLEVPVDCEMGTVCAIQNYFDHDPGPSRMDYACGRLSYDGHDGTDFRVPDSPTMERGVSVVAAAPGVVKGTRDGMPDVNVNKIGRDALRGRHAGNGVVIDHGGGWETQYSHLRSGSIAVKKGQVVEAGDHLGLIGLSGNAEFPHVEFEVRYDGERVDPFVGRVPFRKCGDSRQPMWSQAALQRMAYQPTGPLIAGFSTGRPDPEAARAGSYNTDRISLDAKVLGFWVEIFGAMEGDVQRVRIEDPDGKPVGTFESAIEESSVIWFMYSGWERPAGGWVPGTYTGTYALTREGNVVLDIGKRVVLGNGD